MTLYKNRARQGTSTEQETIMEAHQRLELAHTLMLLAFLGFIVATLNAYVWDFNQGLGVQILSHVLMLVFPVVFKLSYVMRLHSLKSMGLEAH